MKPSNTMLLQFQYLTILALGTYCWERETLYNMQFGLCISFVAFSCLVAASGPSRKLRSIFPCYPLDTTKVEILTAWNSNLSGLPHRWYFSHWNFWSRPLPRQLRGRYQYYTWHRRHCSQSCTRMCTVSRIQHLIYENRNVKLTL